ncbi:MAG: hypothetical protein H0V95_12100 [Actinobacteria bacterium]|nr:hypothetical protein [Actinomycetota bacterium]
MTGPAALIALLAFGGEASRGDLDTSWPPVLVAGALMLLALAVVAIVVVVRQARGAARTGGRRTQ